MSQLKDRLIQFARQTGANSISEFERNCGLSNGAVNKCKESLTSESLVKIALRYPSIDLYWLIGLSDAPHTTQTKKVDSAPNVSENIDVKFLLEQIEKKDELIRFFISKKS